MSPNEELDSTPVASGSWPTAGLGMRLYFYCGTIANEITLGLARIHVTRDAAGTSARCSPAGIIRGVGGGQPYAGRFPGDSAGRARRVADRGPQDSISRHTVRKDPLDRPAIDRCVPAGWVHGGPQQQLLPDPSFAHDFGGNEFRGGGNAGLHAIDLRLVYFVPGFRRFQPVHHRTVRNPGAGDAADLS